VVAVAVAAIAATVGTAATAGNPILFFAQLTRVPRFWPLAPTSEVQASPRKLRAGCGCACPCNPSLRSGRIEIHSRLKFC
ncbi:MAG: hypothetical protein WBL63_04975, partial [Candidatus Acidiferrum sp.]